MHAIRTLTAAWFLTLFASATLAGEGIAWQADLDAARAESQKSNRPLMLFITSSNCPYCVKMQNETFRNAAVAAELNEHFVPVKIDRGTHPALERKLAVRLYPTIVIVDDGEVEMRRVTGFVSSPALVATLQKVEAEWLAARPRPGTTVK